jgi:hypothetical protein
MGASIPEVDLAMHLDTHWDEHDIMRFNYHCLQKLSIPTYQELYHIHSKTRSNPMQYIFNEEVHYICAAAICCKT